MLYRSLVLCVPASVVLSISWRCVIGLPTKRNHFRHDLHLQPQAQSSSSVSTNRARDGSVLYLFSSIAIPHSPSTYEMENLSLDGQGGPDMAHPPLGPGPNQQLPPQMFTTAAQLLDMTDSKPSLVLMDISSRPYLLVRVLISVLQLDVERAGNLYI